jgi:anti-sigma B factor antagonist
VKIQTTEYGSLVVLAPQGDLTCEDTEGFARDSRRCIESGTGDLILDCQGLTGADSAGLQLLTDLARECDERGGRIKLCGLTKVCATILEITRLISRFELYDDVEAAIRSFT